MSHIVIMSSTVNITTCGNMCWRAVTGQVAASEQKKIVVISSKAGSFVLSPKMPMMYSYRGSKAALNMYMYALSFETPKQGVILVLLSPGQVNTVPGMKIPNTSPISNCAKAARRWT